jgi:hypothetical protein
MAALINRTSRSQQIAEAHTVQLLNKAKMADDAYITLVQYDFNGAGQLTSHSWTDPTGNTYEFTSGAGEIRFNSTGYGSLNPNDKKLFFRYLNKFVFQFLKKYDEDFNL